MRKYKSVFGLVIIIMLFALTISLALAQGGSKIDINKATVEQLMEIKGIGEKYAERIVEYRDENGPFKQIEDVMEVKGIGTKTFEEIRDLITVESEE